MSVSKLFTKEIPGNFTDLHTRLLALSLSVTFEGVTFSGTDQLIIITSAAT